LPDDNLQQLMDRHDSAAIITAAKR
jgi:hypothetical protein